MIDQNGIIATVGACVEQIPKQCWERCIPVSPESLKKRVESAVLARLAEEQEGRYTLQGMSTRTLEELGFRTFSPKHDFPTEVRNAEEVFGVEWVSIPPQGMTHFTRDIAARAAHPSYLWAFAGNAFLRDSHHVITIYNGQTYYVRNGEGNGQEYGNAVLCSLRGTIGVLVAPQKG